MLDEGRWYAYLIRVKKHTTMDLDIDLVREAAEALGTKRTSETVHAALAEAVALRRRLRLLDLDPDLTLEQLEADRVGRFAGSR
jgi:Arc/MetJ family transcription regulator